MKNAGGVFSEKLAIKPSGFINLQDEQGNLHSLFTHHAYGVDTSPEGLYKLAYMVQSKHPDLVFKFERDETGQSISYVVSEKPKNQ